ncbi:MAG TPA: TonB-dependent receptor [Bacteroidales bacterium]|nr:TonB-dependent receptor [Bacteroidales bacterium]
MKLTLFLSLFAVIQLWATETYSQLTHLTLKLDDVTICDALKEIENQSEFFFLYSPKLIDVERKVNIDAENETIKDILTGIFDKNVKFAAYDRQIILTPSDQPGILSVLLQENKISGIVTDKDGAPLAGVNVVVTGTTLGVITNIAGKYNIDVPPGSKTLKFTFIGMEPQKISIGALTQINVTMAESAVGLEEVVVVGYGTQKKVNLTGSVSSIKFDEGITNRPLTDASQVLSGTVTGVWVSQNSGKPGGDGSQIRIRGWGTMNNSNPLVIIDGVEGSFHQLNANDIESISVLKDAASSAIYGSKAANGVILITTKMGKYNEKMLINYSSYGGIQSLGRRYDLIDNSTEYMNLWNQALDNVGSSHKFPDYLISDFKNGTDPFKYPNSNFYDYIFRNSAIQEQNISIRGGSAQSSVFLSFNYLNQEGIVLRTNSQRYGITANLESNVKKWLKVGGRINYIRTVSKEPYSMDRVLLMLSSVAPFTAPYTRDGRFGSVQAIDNNGNLLFDNRNPLIDDANGRTITEKNSLRANAYAEIKFADNLIFKTTLATTGNWQLIDKYNQSIYGYTDSGIETMNGNYNQGGLEMNRGNTSSLDNNLIATINYHKVFGDIHNFSTVLGMQMENTVIKTLYARRTLPPKEGLTQVDAGTSGIQGSGNMFAINMLSYFGRLNYSLLDKYLFEADFRADGSSRFEKTNRWGIFPGFSVGWRLNDEDFIKNLNIFSNLKLRGSWGQLGNQNISGYWPYLTVISQDNTLSYSYGGTFAPGSAVTSLVDENITWETTSTLDFGLDIGLFNDKVTVETDYFNKNTSGIIVQLPIPLIMGGIIAPYQNVGEMTNKGFEINVNYDNQVQKREQFRYSIGVNLTYVDNEVTKFEGGKSPDQLYLIREGYSYKCLYHYKVIGIFQTDDEAAQYMYSNGYQPKAGELKFEDVNQDGKLGFEDKQGLGNTIPKFTFGITPGFQYKGFDLNILFQGIAGVHAYTANDFTNLTIASTITKRWRNAWTPENTNTDIPMIRFDVWDNQASSFWVTECSYVKLKNMRLGYSFPDIFSSRLGLEKIYVYANAQNLFSIVSKNYDGYDPERDTFYLGANLYPVPRIISFGVNLNF